MAIISTALLFVVLWSILLLRIFGLKEVSRSLFGLLLLTMLCSLATLGYAFEPADDGYFSMFDVVRYYSEVDALRFEGVHLLFHEMLISKEPIIYLYYYLFSIPDSNNWLIFGVSFMVYGAVFYVMYDMGSVKTTVTGQRLTTLPRTSENIRIDYILMCVLVVSALNFFSDIVNTLRAELAYSCCALSVYLYFRQKISYLTSLILILSACGVHNSVFLILIFHIAYHLAPKIYIYKFYIAAAIGLLCQIIMRNDMRNVPFLDQGEFAYLGYFASYETNMPLYWIAAVALLIVMYKFAGIGIKNISSKNIADILKVYQIITVVTIGFTGYIYFSRLLIFLSVLSPVAIYFTAKSICKKNIFTLNIAAVILALGLISYNYLVFVERLVQSSSGFM